MVRGISIHVGVNEIDGAHYGTSGALRGCENDARAMRSIATDYGYESTILLTREATAKNVLGKLEEAAKHLKSGDILFLSYAGHGSQVRDTSSEELDKMDETWCLYDRMVLDDELYRIWGSLKPGVRVVMVSDSCHSATMSRFIEAVEEFNEQTEFGVPLIVPRGLPSEIAEEVVAKALDLYGGIKYSAFRDGLNEISATVLLLSACQDHETAGDGAKHGKFTEALLGTWNNGKFDGHYRQLLDGISRRLSKQRPNYSTVGAPNPAFESQLPFTISGARPGKGANVPPPVGDLEGLSIEERLARVKAAYRGSNRALNREHAEVGCKFELGLDRGVFNQMNEGDVYNFLRSEGLDALMRAYMQVAAVALPSEGNVNCRVTQSGDVNCTGSINVQF